MRISSIVFLLFIALTFSRCHPKILTSQESSFLSVQQHVEQEKDLFQMIQPYRKNLEAEMNVPIGYSEAEMSHRGIGETALGNFVADVQKSFAEEILGYEIDLSVMNNGGLRNSLPKGEITIGNIYELSPFDNYLYILALEAKDIQNLAEYIVQNKNIGINGLLLKSEAGVIETLKLNGQELQEGRVYKLAINDYLANGGDNMAFLKDLPRLEISNHLLRDILIRQIKLKKEKGLSISSQIEGRQILK